MHPLSEDNSQPWSMIKSYFSISDDIFFLRGRMRRARAIRDSAGWTGQLVELIVYLDAFLDLNCALYLQYCNLEGT